MENDHEDQNISVFPSKHSTYGFILKVPKGVSILCICLLMYRLQPEYFHTFSCTRNSFCIE